MIDDLQRRARLVDEMGLGPLWLVRAGATQSAGPIEQAAPAMSAELAEQGAKLRAAAMPADRYEDQAEQHAPTAPMVPEAPIVPIVPIAAMEPAARMPSAALVTESAAAAAAAPDPGVASMDWETLEQTVSACTRCGLCQGRTNTVFGVGDRKARWMFIGEGPGREEDLRGEPFVGRAGQLLDNMLGAIALARDANAYIANIVKCRPTDAAGKDRRPSADEASTCLPYLERQIALVQPDVIVALGKTAAVTLLGMDPETPVSSLRGKVHRYAGRPLVVSYHPAYLLRTPIDKKKAWSDLCLATAEYARFGEPGADPAA